MPNQTKPLRVLHLEDDDLAAELVRKCLCNSDLECEVTRVEERAEYLAHITRSEQDILLVDFSLPDIDGITALELAQEHCPDTPFIFVSGQLGEETAIECLKNGVTDFVLKDRLARLPNAVEHAVSEASLLRERQAAELALRENERRYRSLIEGLNDLVCDIEWNGTIRYTSPKFADVLGYPTGELLGRNLLNLIHDEERDEASVKLTGHDFFHEFRMRHREQGWVWIESSSQESRTDDHSHGILVLRDITSRKQAEEQREHLEAQLLQAQKMEAIGTLAGGIAHDFNNLLTGILGHADLARRKLDNDHPVQHFLGGVLNATNRARELVAQILAFSRQSENKYAALNLWDVVAEAVQLLEATLPAKMEISMVNEAGDTVVFGDATQIHQIIMNLAANAFHAMATTGGTFRILQTRVAVDEELARANSRLEPGEYVRLSCSDSGCGMEHSQIDRIFDPFFTTKTPAEGTGLGLSAVHGIVGNHGGAITVESVLQLGTTFHIYLPLCEERAQLARPIENDVPDGAGQHVLMVDDKADMVEIGSMMLELAGYRVTTYTDPRQALAAVNDSPAQFDAVITDLTMPVMTGRELASQLLAVRPDLPIILSSGFRGDLDADQARRLGFRDVLGKPYNVRQLGETLARVFR